ncbi:GntR family transcriptional regulator [Pseudomaricurvus alkylphenolicus]|jgi:GntR family transcriptional regulator|uniref:GntR family transcriptional regulator n=1 Tax=Pseudomaricurvus alkylphenolicus TaxID=1306991 RepID=UPI001420A239|nr:GntR family transcriptional regulator [Pseudomaricurvus alkylphenolicus]NIB40461.1 GntR family transcriptional regulator [Pseudomaricurvus alkylphenolicus]
MSLSKGFQPLYKQVYDLLTERLVEGYWKPSEPLPSEMALAAELGVSQGTVRKALNHMVAENLLERRQGKGTYVAEHTQESSLFRFFRLREPQGESMIPETEVLGSSRRAPTKEERKKLGLEGKTQVVELLRVRYLNGEPAIVEKVIQPLSVFPDIDKQTELPNALYILYQEKYGISIVSVKDELHATALPKEYAKQLGLPAGSPVLMVERQSINIDGRVVECSQAYCSTENFVYAVHLK